VLKVSVGPQAAGWCRLALPAVAFSNGTYFYSLQARRAGAKALAVKGTLIAAR